MFGKPIRDVTAADIDRLCKDAVRESGVVEFKRALQGKDGPDAWHDGVDKISDRARNELVSEIIAFANAHGGTLVLGIGETKDRPPRAEAIAQVRACADLAGRLALILRDVAEPPLGSVTK